VKILDFGLAKLQPSKVTNSDGPTASYQQPTVWLQPIPAGEPSRIGDFKASAASFFPDGQQVVYDHSLWRMRRDGSEKLRLISSGLVAAEGTVVSGCTQDRLRGAVLGSSKGIAVYTIPADGGTPEKITDNALLSLSAIECKIDGGHSSH